MSLRVIIFRVIAILVAAGPAFAQTDPNEIAKKRAALLAEIASAKDINQIEEMLSRVKEFEVACAGLDKLEEIILSERKRDTNDVFIIKEISPKWEGTKGKLVFVGEGDLNKVSVNKHDIGVVWRIPSLGTTKEDLSKGYGIPYIKAIMVGGIYPNDVNIQFATVDVQGKILNLPGGTADSIHRFIGRIKLGSYTFISEKDLWYPLTFALVKDIGYVYIRGKGRVIMENGQEIKLGN